MTLLAGTELETYDEDPDGSITWLKRLQAALGTRNSRISLFDSYYRGHHRMQFQTPKFQSTFGGMFHEFADNWTPLVVDAVVERLNPVGFRLGADSDKGDKDAQYMWQANGLDSEINMGFLEAILREEAYLLVWNDPDTDFEVNGEKIPAITVEDPSQCIVIMSSENRRKRAAGGIFFVDDDGYPCATIYLPKWVYKYRSATKDPRASDLYVNQINYFNDRPAGGGSRTVNTPSVLPGNPSAIDSFGFNSFNWQPRFVDGENWPLENLLGVVPIIPLRNKPRLLGEPESEIHNVIPIQDAVNKFVTDLLLASEFAAFPQRWATGVEVVFDAQGEPIPFPTGPGSVMSVMNEKATLGVFPEMSGQAHIAAIETVVQHIASQTRTPPHYFYLSGHFPSGDAIKSAEAGLVAKVRNKMLTFGEALEEAVRLAFKVIGDKRYKAVDSETIWRDPESRTEGQHIDAVVKRLALGVPLRQLQEDAGYTQQQIDRFATMREEEIYAWVLASKQAMMAMAAMGVPDPNVAPAVAPSTAKPSGSGGAAKDSATTAPAGYPTGLPNPTSSGAKDAMIASPGSPVALDLRGPRVTA